MTPPEATEKLILATRGGNVADAEAAIEAGADPNAKTDWRRTPLHLAAKNGNTDIARLLIEKGADPNARDDLQLTPLHIAA
jgi:ankyrin repeat protein